MLITVSGLSEPKRVTNAAPTAKTNTARETSAPTSGIIPIKPTTRTPMAMAPSGLICLAEVVPTILSPMARVRLQ